MARKRDHNPPAVKKGRPAVPFSDEVLAQLENYDGLGTVRGLCEYLNISNNVYYRWLKTEPKFCETVLRMRARADDEVESALFNSAIGHSLPPKITKERHVDEKGVARMVTTKVEHQHAAPDTGAQKHWLANRRRHWWGKDAEEHEIDPRLKAIFDRIDRAVSEGRMIDITPKDDLDDLDEQED